MTEAAPPERRSGSVAEPRLRDASVPERATIVLRPMAGPDVDALMVYEDELFGSESWSADSYRAELADSRYRHYLVAERVADRVIERGAKGAEGAAEPGPGVGGGLIGWAGLMVIGETAQVLTIGVVPGQQRRGIGQAMLDALLAEARRRGATEVVLEVRVDNAAARRLYERKPIHPVAGAARVLRPGARRCSGDET